MKEITKTILKRINGIFSFKALSVYYPPFSYKNITLGNSNNYIGQWERTSNYKSVYI